MKTFSVSKSTARRFLLDSQSLLNDNANQCAGSKEVLKMIRKLECVQIDPVSVVQRNQHLVLANRIPGYQPEYLDRLLFQGKVFEYKANEECVIPIEDYPIFEPVRERIRKQLEAPLKELDQVVQGILHRLQNEGPLPSRAFKSENRVHGYWDNKIVRTKETSLALSLLRDAGTIRVVHREGTERFFHLAAHTVPEKILHQTESMEASVARQALIEKYIRAYRLFDARDPRFGWQKLTAAERRAEIEKRIQDGTLVTVDIENVQRQYFILAEDLEKIQGVAETAHKDYTLAEGSIKFLSPLDNLLWRRERVADLFDFHYRWEIYTPRSKRRYGPYAMPILCGDQLIGRIDPRLDRKDGRLVIQLLQLEPCVKLTRQLRNKLRDALEIFAEFHHVEEITVEQTEPSGISI